MTPGQIAQSSGKKVWWRCEHGHEWQATVNNRDHGHGCPVCSGRCFTRGESDLATLHPDLASEWHPTKNSKLTPSDVSAFSRRKVWWVCERGHEWQESVKDRSRSKKCPICAKRKLKPGVNDLGTLRPDLASEWHPSKNGPYTPAGVKVGSRRVAWWTCSHCGHEWQATVLERQTNARCPHCGG